MESRYAELLSDGDLDVLGRASGHGPDDERAAWFRASPDRILSALDDSRTFEAIFDREGSASLETITPVLVFATMIHRGATEIGEHTHVPERVGSRLVIPVFDGERLARYASSPNTLVFLVELLGSYTRVMSGPRWEHTAGRWRRRRFSEMNPAQLAQVAADLPMEDRAGAYRRLGDLALFLNGVFPDHAARETLSPIELERVLRSIPDPSRIDVARLLEADRVDSTGPVLAALGPRWYRLASELVPLPSMSIQLAHAADHFDEARRFLAFVTDRYLWNRRDWLFPAS
jgi:hypothetical protein